MRSVLTLVLFFLAAPCFASLTITSIDRYTWAYARLESTIRSASGADTSLHPGPDGRWPSIDVGFSFSGFINDVYPQQIVVFARQHFGISSSDTSSYISLEVAALADRIGFLGGSSDVWLEAVSHITVSFLVADAININIMDASPGSFSLFNKTTGTLHEGLTLTPGSYDLKVERSEKWNGGSGELDFYNWGGVTLIYDGPIHIAPEPSTIAVWSLLGLGTICIVKRRAFTAH